MDYPTLSFGDMGSVTQFNAPHQFTSPKQLSRVASDDNLDVPEEDAEINTIGYDLLQLQKDGYNQTRNSIDSNKNQFIGDQRAFPKAGKIKIDLQSNTDVFNHPTYVPEFNKPVVLNLTHKLANVDLSSPQSQNGVENILTAGDLNKQKKPEKNPVSLKLELNEIKNANEKVKSTNQKQSQPKKDLNLPLQKEKPSQKSISNKENNSKKAESKTFLKKGHSRNSSNSFAPATKPTITQSSTPSNKSSNQFKQNFLKINTEAVNKEFDDSKECSTIVITEQDHHRILRKDDEKSNLLPDVSLVIQTLSDEPVLNDLKFIKSPTNENPRKEAIFGKIPLQIGSIQVGEDLIDDNIKINPDKSNSEIFLKTPNQNTNDSGKKFLFKFPLSKTPSHAASPFADFFKSFPKKEEDSEVDISISNASKIKGTITRSEIKNKRFLSMTMTDFLDKSFNQNQNALQNTSNTSNITKAHHKSSKSLLPHEEKELSQCTYHPQITSKARRIVAQRESDPAYQKEWHRRLYSYSQKRSMDRDKSAPNLNNLTTSNIIGANTFDLTVSSKVIKGFLNESFTFHPNITKKSKMLQREGRVEDILYNEAKRRQRESIERRSMKSPVPKYTLNKSDQYVAKRLIKEFDELAEVFFHGEKEHKFNYMQMCEFMKQLNFIKSGENNNTQYYVKERSLLYDIWTILQGDKCNGVNERNLLVFLLAIMGLNFEIPSYTKQENSSNNILDHACLNKAEILKADTSSRSSPRKGSNHPSVQNRAEPEAESEQINATLKREESKKVFATLPQSRASMAETDKNSVVINLHEINESEHIQLINRDTKKPIGMIDQHENIKFSAEEIQCIKKAYDVFYLNRLYFTTTSNKIAKNVSASSSTHSFHPEILAASKSMAVNYREKQLERAAKVIAEKELTPPPNGRITHADLLIYQKVAWDHKAEEEKKKNDLRELENCTFKPKTLDYKPIVIDLKAELPAHLDKNNSSNNEHRGEMLYQQSKLNNKPKVDKTSEEFHFEKNLQHLTFHPNINKSQKSQDNFRRQSNEPVKNADKAMQRMIKGREQKEEKKRILERNLYKDNDEKLPAFKFSLDKKEIHGITIAKPTPKHSRKESYAITPTNDSSMIKTDKTTEKHQHEDHLSETSTKKQAILLPRLPISETADGGKLVKNELNEVFDDGTNYGVPKVTQDERYEEDDNVNELLKNYDDGYDKTSELQKKIIEKIPLLFVDVNFGPGKSQRIIVYEGDTAEELADRFSVEHSLDENMRFKLRVLLESHMSGILSKIEEERPSTQSEQDNTLPTRMFTDSR